MNRRNQTRLVAAFMALVLVLTLFAGALASIGGGDDSAATDTTQPYEVVTVPPPTGPDATIATVSTLASDVTLPRVSDLPTVAISELPREAQETLVLIGAGGPFPYDRDGVIFENREGILPDKPEGYYHEYTVTTPGSDDRGARRIVVGESGEFFYTDDHYESFRELIVA